MNILIIRFRQMGDTLLATAMASTLRQACPSARIDIVLNTNLVSLFDNHPAFSNIISFTPEERKSSFRYLKKVWKVMHACRYDAIIDMRSTVNTLPFTLFSMHSRYRIGLKKAYTRGIFNFAKEPCRKDEAMLAHNLSLALPLLQVLGGQSPTEEVPSRRYVELLGKQRFTLNITDEEIDHMREKMTRAGISFNRPVVLVGVTAKLANKTLPAEAMTELVKRFCQTFPDAQLVFNFAPGRERENAYAIYEAVGRLPQIFMTVEAKSMRQLAAMASLCTLYFGNEGGARHVVHAMGVPSFAVFSPRTSIACWLPLNDVPAEGIAVTHVATEETLRKLSPEERYKLLSADVVWDRLLPFATPFMNGGR